MARRCSHDYVSPSSVLSWEILDRVSKFQLLKKDPAPRSQLKFKGLYIRIYVHGVYECM
jgi:hypothetical protein